jgi:aldose 1-epimerase
VTIHDPASGHAVALWADARHPWFMVYTGDDLGGAARRRAIAVEPMTAQADAFRSGQDLVMLAPSGQPGDEFSASWGIRSLD